VDLICVGDVMLDVRVDAGRLVRGGDVHGRVHVHPGGTSANAAVWAASSGAEVRVIAAVGDDLAGRLLIASLRERGVDVSAIRSVAGAATGTMLVVHEAGERSMVADRGANAGLRPSELPETLDAGAVLVSGYLLLQDGTRDTATEAIRRARSPWVTVEAATWPLVEAAGADRFHRLAEGATAILANEREALSLTGLAPDAAAKALGEWYRLACVKQGADGAVMVLDGTEHRAVAEPAVEGDPTGAGDAFDGVLLASLARGSTPEEVLAAACRAGAVVAGSGSTWPEDPG
jgi:sugar/nucleoside kinase (ribokinase family)